MEEGKLLSNYKEEREFTNLDSELRDIMAEFMVGVIKFEELGEVVSKFLFKFRQALEYLRRPSIYESELVKSIIKANETKRANAYIKAGCTNSYDGRQSVTQMNTSLYELQICLTKAKSIVSELENLMIKAGNALCTNSNNQTEELQGSETSEKLNAADCASFMAAIYSMVKQDYIMQEKIVSSLHFKSSSGEMESYCFMWTLRPFINDDVINHALRQKHKRQTDLGTHEGGGGCIFEGGCGGGCHCKLWALSHYAGFIEQKSSLTHWTILFAGLNSLV